MGAWGVDTFDNDTACDWASELTKRNDLSLVDEALASAAVDNDDECLDADKATEALAACEVVARLKGKWGARNAYTETIDAWVKAHPTRVSPDLTRRALAAIDHVLAENSELRELWDDGDDTQDWLQSVQNLRARIES